MTKSNSKFQGGLSPANWEKGSALLNHIGYAALMFSAVDYGAILIPFRFTNPTWELDVIKQLINQVIVLLVAFGLIFYRPMTVNRAFTKQLLRFFSWLCLLIGIIYLLLLPLAMINTGRLTLIQQNNVNGRLNQLLKANAELVKQISRPGISDRELQLWAREARLTPQTLEKDRAANISLQQSVLNQLKILRDTAQEQAKLTLSTAQKQSLKDSISIISRGLISAVAFIWMWYITGWARKGARKSQRKSRSSQVLNQTSNQSSFQNSENIDVDQLEMEEFAQTKAEDSNHPAK